MVCNVALTNNRTPKRGHDAKAFANSFFAAFFFFVIAYIIQQQCSIHRYILPRMVLFHFPLRFVFEISLDFIPAHISVHIQNPQVQMMVEPLSIFVIASKNATRSFEPCWC